MKKNRIVIGTLTSILAFLFFSFITNKKVSPYEQLYFDQIQILKEQTNQLLALIQQSDLKIEKDLLVVKNKILAGRIAMKRLDFWTRYLEPLSYKKINSPLPIEWETEVFEKYEAPYKRTGTGFTLAWQYLESENAVKDSLISLLLPIAGALEVYTNDSISENLSSYQHFFLCNRLFILNLATIYTNGFECPSAKTIIPELKQMMHFQFQVYQTYNSSFPLQKIPENYLKLYEATLQFISQSSDNYEEFDHYEFIKDFINPLFGLNQELIRSYKVVSKSFQDYTLNKSCNSIFDKSLFHAQNSKGVFLRVSDPQKLGEIEKTGEMLFSDPILSGNNLRSCASCHKPNEFFTDTVLNTSFSFDKINFLSRNSPSLLNAKFNHLIMNDGKHLNLLQQTQAVITNSLEMAGVEKELLKKILSCKDYKNAFNKYAKLTPQMPQISMQHIYSALILYYGKFSNCSSPFDDAMNKKVELEASAKKGFNLFMSKAQCSTCHFAPIFNGVKPPYLSSEFEVLGVPADTLYSKLSSDEGRYMVHAVPEMKNAFRTSTIRNAEHNKPYMHNGVFNNLEQVIEFYNIGGGAGRGLQVPNQTLPVDSLKLDVEEKRCLIAFIKSLNEMLPVASPPAKLPHSKVKALNQRIPKGIY